MPGPTLLIDDNRGFRTWHIDQIYKGPTSGPEENIVPNVDDAVFDWGNVIYRVISVDSISRVSVLAVFDPTANIQGEPANILTALSGYQPTIQYRAFLDTSGLRNTFSIDTRFVIHGSDANKAKLFKGTDTLNGQVISIELNSSGDVIGEDISLELIDLNNNTMSRPTLINTNADLDDGELVTLVVYAQTGGVTGETTFVVKNSSAIRAAGASSVYITDVVLISPLLSDTISDLIELPANVPVTAANFAAEVVYSDGTRITMPIDGNRVKLHGLENFNIALSGANASVVLSYYPLPGEAAINANGSSATHVHRTYRTVATGADVSYSFRLNVIPIYNGLGAYTLRYFLTNTERDVSMFLSQSAVTMQQLDGQPVVLSANGIMQTIVASFVPGDTLGGLFGDYVYTERFDLVLSDPALPNTDPFIVDYIGDGNTTYGVDVMMHAANNGSNNPISLGFGYSTYSEWLAALYYKTSPPFDGASESSAPDPTHFRIWDGAVVSADIHVAEWNSAIDHLTGGTWSVYQTIYIEWLFEAAGNMQTLSVSPALVLTDLVA